MLKDTAHPAAQNDDVESPYESVTSSPVESPNSAAKSENTDAAVSLFPTRAALARQPNHTARTAEQDTKFFEALAEGYPVRIACKNAEYKRQVVYRWRGEDPKFKELWFDSLTIADDLLEEEANRRGRVGYDEAVYYRGVLIGYRRKYSDRLLLARLKAVRPELYGTANDRRAFLKPSNPPKVEFVVRNHLLEACERAKLQKQS